MICDPCKKANDPNNPELHEFCDNIRLPEGNNSHCDCHHRVGTLQNIQPETVQQMVEQGRSIIPAQVESTPPAPAP